MSNIKTYDTYIEITNGLFVDIEDEKDYILKNNIEDVFKSIVVGADIVNSPNREVVLFSGSGGYRQFNRAMQEEAYRQIINYESASPRTNNTTTERALNEEIWHQVRNMSEEETIQYFDRISQEEN